ncbi:Uncharacterised protein [Burkholderia pseudomallei]|nr:Uncharacterised protein [Burkholderia pseudomallei]
MPAGFARDARDGAVLMDARAACDGRAREPERVVERMQMAAVRIEEAAEIAVRLHVLRERVALDVAQARIAEAARRFVARAAQRVDVTRLVRGAQIAGHERAIDRMLRDPLLGDRERFEPHVPDQPDFVGVQIRLERVDSAGEAADQLAAVAPARRPSHLRRLEDRNRMAALGEIERRRYAGQAGADHADVGIDRAFQWRMAGGVVDGGRVV